jgi:23S rRNA pseudouridine2605 synthase
MSEERLQKILARAGIASRRKAEEMIREGRVTINGQPAAIGDKADLEHDSVKLDERRIQPPRPGASHRYLLLNKPRGVMSTVNDPAGRPTVIDLVPPALRRALAPVGRLDFHTEGLLLLTDDGELAQQVAHPSFGCWKTYEVKVRGRPETEQLDRLRAGLVLDGRRTAPCRITPLQRRTPVAQRRRGVVESENSWWSVELGEGRTRQIREMFQRIGHPVQKLRRVAIGPVRDPNLPVGSLRELTDREVAALRKSRPPALPAAAKRRPDGGRPADVANPPAAPSAAKSRAGGGRPASLTDPSGVPTSKRQPPRTPRLPGAKSAARPRPAPSRSAARPGAARRSGPGEGRAGASAPAGRRGAVSSRRPGPGAGRRPPAGAARRSESAAPRPAWRSESAAPRTPRRSDATPPAGSAGRRTGRAAAPAVAGRAKRSAPAHRPGGPATGAARPSFRPGGSAKPSHRPGSPAKLSPRPGAGGKPSRRPGPGPGGASPPRREGGGTSPFRGGSAARPPRGRPGRAPGGASPPRRGGGGAAPPRGGGPAKPSRGRRGH